MSDTLLPEFWLAGLVGLAFVVGAVGLWVRRSLMLGEAKRVAASLDASYSSGRLSRRLRELLAAYNAARARKALGGKVDLYAIASDLLREHRLEQLERH